MEPLQSSHVSFDTNCLVVVEKLSDWKKEFPALKVVTVNEYLNNPLFFKMKNIKVINLVRSYRYLSRGYYCSLLAEARNHKIIPTVRTISDLSKKSSYRIDVESDEDIDDVLMKSLKKIIKPDIGITALETHVFFGHSEHQFFERIGQEIFDTFRFPLIKAEFRKQGVKWEIDSLKPLTLQTMPQELEPLFIKSLEKYTQKKWFKQKEKSEPRYDLAILWNPKEKFPPSNKTALNKLVRIGKSLNLGVDMIEKKDYHRLGEYDGLFIRETTAIDHHTYLFSKKASVEGLVVIDDPDSILRCTNKVYLAEILKSNKIATPKSVIFVKDMKIETLEEQLAYPVVVKIPDGSFSLGVFKADDRKQFEIISDRLFKKSEIILVQEFMYTEFDWRVGILNRKPIYASKYFMSEKHWQVYEHSARGRYKTGGTKTVHVDDAPDEVIRAALKAANLVGDGLYGVDLKATEKGVVVIEVNDNPNLDNGIEDVILKDELYRIVLKDFIMRIDAKKGRLAGM
ncbi:MAG TPA: RimK family protein [Spirochaetota bacterium]|nr:RimK family protein [Spirochaetota bacterium]HRZ26789.1 RimK family protein [Spirochaetota bacterium]HSA13374.1 RimK family protein [Spirochaetota bacterium]